MGTVNKVILVGNLGRDAELRYTPGGAAVATLSLATTEMWNDKGGQRQEKTEWHRVVLWGKQAETLNEYLVKGNRSTSRAGFRRASGTTRTATSATRPRFAGIASCCSAAAAGRREAPARMPQESGEPQEPAVPVTDDDIPF